MTLVKTGNETTLCEDQPDDGCRLSNIADRENKSNDITTQWLSRQSPDGEEEKDIKRRDIVGDLLTPEVVEDILGPEEDTQ